MALPDYLQDTAIDFAKQLPATTSVPIDTTKFTGRQFVAGEDPLQTQAINLARSGVGAYQPFLTAAQAAQQQAAGTVGGLSGLTGASAYQPFMSPYQQQVIDTTLTEFDRSRGTGRQSIQDAAYDSGNFGGDADFTYNSTTNTLTIKNLIAESVNPPSTLTGTYTISSPTTITLDPTSEIINDAPMKLKGYTVSQLGSLTSSAGAMVYCTDETGGSIPAFYDGTNWRRVSDRAIVS